MSIMRKPMAQPICCLFLAILAVLQAPSASAIDLAWDASPDEAAGKVKGYSVVYGIQDFTVPGVANVSVVSLPPSLSRTATISNLLGGLTYYISVVSIGTNDVQGDFSNVAIYTVPADLPQLPPLPDGSGNTNTTGSGAGSTSGSSSGSGGTGSTSGGTSAAPTNQINLLGMLPRLWLYPTNGVALLALQGTVGATFAIQSSTNPAVADSWVTVTNIKLSAIAPTANATPGTTLEKAFIPALEAFQDPSPIDGTLRYYRIYMPLGYPVLADQVLAQQGFTPRLVAVRCPGLSGYVVCYVTEEAAYLDYNDKTYIVKLQASGPTIREVATTVATTLSQNWTSASEFTVADDGEKFLFATVVHTDDPSTDAPLGVARASSSTILIDF